MFVMTRIRAEAGRSGAPPGFVGRGGEGRIGIWLCLGPNPLLLPFLGRVGLTRTIVIITIKGRNVDGVVLATRFGANIVRGSG